MGTRALHMAMYVVYEAHFQMVSDHPTVYGDESFFQFINDVPVTWDADSSPKNVTIQEQVVDAARVLKVKLASAGRLAVRLASVKP